MGAVKTDHKRDAHLRTIAKVCRKWDREDQAKEAAEVRRHNRAVKAHKMKRLYPNSIAPERLATQLARQFEKLIGHELYVADGWSKEDFAWSLDALKMDGITHINGIDLRRYKTRGIDLASGKDQTGYGGRII